MNVDVDPSDWREIDPWWQTYARPQSVARLPDGARVVDIDRLTRCWDGLEPWWREYTESSPVEMEPSLGGEISSDRMVDSWKDLDPWWDVYAEMGHETAIALSELLERSTVEWSNSNALFDTDPLAADLTGNRLSRGPPQPSNEVEWSRWLAQLLRPSKALVSELFDVAVESSPPSVWATTECLRQMSRAATARCLSRGCPRRSSRHSSRIPRRSCRPSEYLRHPAFEEGFGTGVLKLS